MKKEARIVTTQIDNISYYVIEIFDGKNWDWGFGFPIENYNRIIGSIDHEVVTTEIVDKLMSLIMQGYIIYDER